MATNISKLQKLRRTNYRNGKMKKKKLSIIGFGLLALMLIACGLRVRESEETCTDNATTVIMTIHNASDNKTYWINVRGEINLDDEGKNGEPRNFIGDTVVLPKDVKDFTLNLPPRTTGFIVNVYQVEYNEVDARIETIIKTYRSDNVCV